MNFAQFVGDATEPVGVFEAFFAVGSIIGHIIFQEVVAALVVAAIEKQARTE